MCPSIFAKQGIPVLLSCLSIHPSIYSVYNLRVGPLMIVFMIITEKNCVHTRIFGGVNQSGWGLALGEENTLPYS